jgi:hypothetical protein
MCAISTGARPVPVAQGMPSEGSMATVDETDGVPAGDVRDTIFTQHVVLRGLLSELVETAEQALRADGMADLLRTRARLLYDSLATHMAYEEQVLSIALSDVIGWGAVIHDKMESDHTRQREELSQAISALVPGQRSLDALVEDVRAFARTLLLDMETEEQGLMKADIDALTVDSRGG